MQQLAKLTSIITFLLIGTNGAPRDGQVGRAAQDPIWQADGPTEGSKWIFGLKESRDLPRTRNYFGTPLIGTIPQNDVEVQQESVTVLQTHKPTVQWTIRNFKLFRDKDPNSEFRISSPIIYQDNWGHWAMSAALKPAVTTSVSSSYNYNGHEEEDRRITRSWSLEVTIVATNTTGQVFLPPANVTAAVLGGADHKTLLDKVGLVQQSKINWYHTTFIKTKHLEDNLRTYLPANDLTLWFEITQESSFHLVEYKDLESSPRNAKATSQSNLTMQLFHTYQQAKWTDCKLVSNDGIVVPVHRVVLASMSPVLDAMLINSTEIRTELPSSILKEFVRFLYTGELSKTMTAAEHLLVAAETYQVPSLKEACQRVLVEHITIESVAQLLVLAETHNAPKLKSVALDYALRNFQQVSKTASWKKTLKTHPELTVDSVMAVVAKFTSG